MAGDGELGEATGGGGGSGEETGWWGSIAAGSGGGGGDEANYWLRGDGPAKLVMGLHGQ